MDNPLFLPHPLLRNPHMMTIVPSISLGRHQKLHDLAEALLVDVAQDSKILLHYHKTNESINTSTLLLVHGLEGSSSSPYLLNITAKALDLGFNVARMNLRNCGGTLDLSPTLYNAGMSGDVIAVIDYLRKTNRARDVILVGYSLGGNIVLKAAAELGSSADPQIRAVCAVSPSLDLHACVSAIESGVNRFYEIRFLLGLKTKIRAKSKLFSDRFDATLLPGIRTLRQFDETYTAPDAGYSSAGEYYSQASSLPIANNISVPTLIIAAQDDPIVPFSSFLDASLKSPFITLLCPTAGGHGGFIQRDVENSKTIKNADRAWAENRLLEFCLRHHSR